MKIMLSQNYPVDSIINVICFLKTNFSHEHFAHHGIVADLSNKHQQKALKVPDLRVEWHDNLSFLLKSLWMYE